MKSNNGFHKYVPSMLLFLLFEAVAATLWHDACERNVLERTTIDGDSPVLEAS